jgi:hypothetical protein
MNIIGGKQVPKESRPGSTPADTVTVLLTTHNRPLRLDRAFYSCVDNGIKRIAIADTSDNQDAIEWVERRAGEFRGDCTLVRARGMLTNDAWLSAAQCCKTKYIQILHDDDALSPCWAESVAPWIASSARVIVSDAVNRGFDDGFRHSLPPEFLVGQIDAQKMMDLLMTPGSLTISPVRGIFLASSVRTAFTMFKGLYKNEILYLKPDFPTGNDLLLWFVALSGGDAVNTGLPAVEFGSWHGSATIQDLSTGNPRHPAIYDFVREYWKTSQ